MRHHHELRLARSTRIHSRDDRVWEKGYKNVYAVVSQRSGESAFRRFFANAFYALASLLSESPIRVTSAIFAWSIA